MPRAWGPPAARVVPALVQRVTDAQVLGQVVPWVRLVLAG